MARRVKAAALGFGLAFALAGNAFAQQTPPFQRNIDVQSFRLAPGPGNFLTVAGARVFGNPFSFSAGLFFNYAHNPFVIYDANCPSQSTDVGCTPGAVRSAPVQHLMTANILASLTLFDRIQIGLDIPASVVIGDQVDPATARATGATQTAFALGDPRLEIKARIVGDATNGPGFAVALFGQFPIGQLIAQNTFLGDNSFIFGGRLIGDLKLGRFSAAINGGVAIRPETLTFLSSYVGNRITWGAAAGFDIIEYRPGSSPFGLTALLEAYGSTDLSHPDVIQQNTAEADLAVRARVGDLYISLGGGTGIVRGVSLPDARAFLGLMYSPLRADRDHDNIMDDVDSCPDNAEDKDGFEDSNGCPEPDNDQDQLLDEADRCPNEAEDRDEFQDEDGCPDNDNDNDGVHDDYDTCRNEPEDRDGDRDTDGCPEDDRDRDGIGDVPDKCPTEPEDTDGFEDEDGCPELDNDRDGIPDQGEPGDQCPDQPETINAFQDEDGCPDELPDRDHDGITDDKDQCPDQPETYNGQTDEDGCPEARQRPLITIEGDQIRILQQVNFANDSDRIVGAPSFRVLDAVVAILGAHPELPRIDIQGHTDDRGNADHNRELSQRRAESVRQYLIQHGVADSRLVAHGFGPDRPVGPNNNNRNRAKNRRVEFHVVAADGSTQTQIHEPAQPTQ